MVQIVKWFFLSKIDRLMLLFPQTTGYKWNLITTGSARKTPVIYWSRVWKMKEGISFRRHPSKTAVFIKIVVQKHLHAQCFLPTRWRSLLSKQHVGRPSLTWCLVTSVHLQGRGYDIWCCCLYRRRKWAETRVSVRSTERKWSTHCSRTTPKKRAQRAFHRPDINNNYLPETMLYVKDIW